jgi:hypothetical protein
MIEDTTGAPRPQPAWHNRAWVLALMYHPDNAQILERVRVTGRDYVPDAPLPGMVEAWHAGNLEALLYSYTAGAVLAVLYALTRAGWTLPRKRVASVRFAIACVVTGGKAASTRDTDDPVWARGIPFRCAVPLLHTGRTKVRECWKKRCHVAHLWSALILYCQGFMGTRGVAEPLDLLSTDEGLRALLATARDVQQFARNYRDPAKGKPIDFGPMHWWVPDGLHRSPVWPPSIPAHWITACARNYGIEDEPAK